MTAVQEQIVNKMKQLIGPSPEIGVTGGKQQSTGNNYPNASVIDLRKHVGGKATFAIDTIYEEPAGVKMCKWGVVDIDEKGEEGLEKAYEIAAFLESNGIKTGLAFSGSKGFHVYVFSDPVPAEFMKKALKKTKAGFSFNGETVPGDALRCKPAPCRHQVAGKMSYLFKDKPYDDSFDLKGLPDGFYEHQLAILENIIPTPANAFIMFATTEKQTEEQGDIEEMIPEFTRSEGYISPCINELVNKGGAESLGTYDKNNLTLMVFCKSTGLDSRKSLSFAKTMAENATDGPVQTTKSKKAKISHFRSIKNSKHEFNCTYLLKARKELKFDCSGCAIRPKGVKIPKDAKFDRSQKSGDDGKTLLLEPTITEDLLAWFVQKGGEYEHVAPEILPPEPYGTGAQKAGGSRCYLPRMILEALGEGITSESSLAGWFDSHASKENGKAVSDFGNDKFIENSEDNPGNVLFELKNALLLKFRKLKTAKLVDEDTYQENLERAVDRSMRYRIKSLSNGLIEQCSNLPVDIHTSSTDCSHAIGKILSASQQGAVVSVEANAVPLLEFLMGSGAGRVPTPFPMLNDLTGGGFANGTKTALVSPPGGGKSTVSAQFADYAASKCIPTIFVSMEMSLEQIFVNSLARAGNINSSKIMSPYVAIKDAVMGQVADLAETYFETAGKYLHIIEGGYNTTPAKIATMISKVRADLKTSRKDPFLVVIDYLQLLYTGIDAIDTGPNETQKISELAVRVKQLARDANVAVVALSDVTKEEQKNSNESKELTLNSLRGSNRIAHAADTVIALYSESAQSDGGKAKVDPWEVYVSKVKSSENATEVIQSILNAQQEHPVGGDGAMVYARMELIKNRAGQGRGSQFLLYSRAYHRFDPVMLPGQEKAEGRA